MSRINPLQETPSPATQLSIHEFKSLADRWEARLYSCNHALGLYSARILLKVGDSLRNHRWGRVAPLLQSPMLLNHKELVLIPFLAVLCQSEIVDLRAAVAKHRMATTKTRTRLATDKSARARAVLATNPEVTATDFNQFSSDPEPQVRQATTQQLLEAL